MFPKDILLYDIESTGIDIAKSEPIQLSAILLNRDSLEEIKSFSSYIKADLSQSDPESAKVHGITEETLNGALDKKAVGEMFIKEFGFDVLLSSWVEFLDRRMLEKIIKATGVDFRKYDYHYLDLWPIAYTYLLNKGVKLENLQSDEIYKNFNLPQRGFHDALEDCRLAADVFRQIMGK